MAYFTENNTEGFTAEELATLNAAMDILEAEGIDDDMGRASDALNNVYFEGATTEDLVAAVRRRFGRA